MRPTVVIVDDHADFRDAATALLDAEGFHVIGAARDGAGALDAVARLRPEVVVLDIQLPDLDGFSVAERITAEPDAPAVVLVSSRDPSDFGTLVTVSGAKGFIAKGELSGAAIAELL
jgi:DNA-binding NarL/FixJ family response regulator